MSHRGAVLTLYSVAALFALVALAMVTLHNPWIALLLIAMLAGAIAIFLGFVYRRLGRLVRPERQRRTPGQTPTVAGLDSPQQARRSS